MARKNDNGGCGFGVLIIIGMIVSIITHMGIVLVIGAAVAGTIYLIYKLVSFHAARKKEYVTSATEEKEEYVISTSRTKEEEKSSLKSGAHSETALIAANAEKVKSIIHLYQVERIALPTALADPLQNEMKTFQSVEVLQAVNRLRAQKESYAEKANAIKEEIDRILDCPGCTEAKEQLDFLESQKAYLTEKHKEYTQLKKRFRTSKITLTCKNSQAFTNLVSAIEKVQQSQKKGNHLGVPFDKFAKLNAKLPDDLFSCAVKPVALDFGAYRFFLLPEVILVYAKQNKFVTAFEPTTLIVTCKDVEKSVSMSKSGYGGKWQFNDTLISDDSIRVSEGVTRTTWQYERRDGGPDMRYSNNPMHQYRTDVFRYGEIQFQIGKYQVQYAFSAGNATKTIKTLIRDYTSIIHKLNTTPSLLRLLESTSRKTQNAHSLYEGYAKINENNFCEIE